MEIKMSQDETDRRKAVPLIRINKLAEEYWATTKAQQEWYNVCGSVKDRMAFYLIGYAEAMAKLIKETVLEASGCHPSL